MSGRETEVEPMTDLTSRLLRKGRSARNRRLVIGWGATGVVAVAAALLGLAGQRTPSAGPAHSGMPSPTAMSIAVPSATVTESGDEDPLVTFAGKLPTGPPIGLVPRAERRGSKVVVVTADHVVSLPTRTGFAFDLTPSAGGLLVAAHSDAFTGGGPDPEQALYLIRPDGSLSRLHLGAFNGLAVDPTGKEYAIAEVGPGAYDKVHVTVASLAQRGQTHSRTEPVATMLAGWTTQGLLMSDTRRVWLWEPGASSQTDLPGVVDASVMPTDSGRLLVDTGLEGPEHCLHPFTIGTRWMGPVLTCGAENGWTVSPDGGRVVVGSTVVDLTTGVVGPVLLDKLATRFVHWEDSSRVLTHIVGPAPKGQIVDFWVRCDVSTGVCEQAPIRGSNGTWRLTDW